MPRERQAARLNARSNFISPNKASSKLTLQDDQQEKSKRLQSRQALQELQLNQIKAAASPARRQKSLGPTDSPRASADHDKENDGLGGLAMVGGNAVNPIKRVPILANFEEWMKMATDNKINATNSWNFALIDYFHDMSLLKEGDGVNFQKASCTLDGCVKIYTSRVDSVATETGKLLSGLADGGSKKKNDNGDAEDGDGAEDDDDEEGGKKTRKRAQRSSEATLVSSFAQLQLKKMELEFSVDPLFKKASADFDEGGAKGLLLNHLTIDGEGRIVFDSSDDILDPEENNQERSDEAEAGEEQADTTDQAGTDTVVEKQEHGQEADGAIDIESLGLRFFPDLTVLDEQDICPSLKTYELGGSSESMDIPFLKAPEDWRKDAESQDLDDAFGSAGNGFGGDEDDDGQIGGFDVGMDIGFGEGGEAWARDAAIDARPRIQTTEGDQGEIETQGLGEVGAYDPNGAAYGVMLARDDEFDRENILKYFDQTLKNNWAGPEHWRIQKIKDNTKPVAATTTKKKEKQPFEIDFLAPLSQSVLDMITTPAASNSAISLPKSQWKTKSRNLLPDDKHFNSKQLLQLFLNPHARIGARRLEQSYNHGRWNVPQGDDVEMDEGYWARRQASVEGYAADTGAGLGGDYDANFFQDDAGFGMGGMGGPEDDNDDNFADAREHFSPGLDGEGRNGLPLDDGATQTIIGSGAFGDQLVTQNRRLRPEYVQYARVAKKVDIRRLKEEMWRGLGLPEPSQSSPDEDVKMEDGRNVEKSADPEQIPEVKTGKEEDGSDEQPGLKFTGIMNGLQSVYPKQAMADISTSFGFICLLHLANEKGLVLQHKEGFEEIVIKRDDTARITEIDA